MKLPRTLTANDDPPIGSIVIDNDGDAYQLGRRNKWHMACARSNKTLLLLFLISNHGPITLVWEPTTTKDN